MIKGIGIDAVELARIKELIENKPQFIQRILTEKESELFSSCQKRQIEFLGDGMLVKKLFESLGTGIGKLSFQDIEVLTNEAGAPVVTKAPHPLHQTFVSITHTNETAFAQILLENE